jgi:hypothetical protein
MIVERVGGPPGIRAEHRPGVRLGGDPAGRLQDREHDPRGDVEGIQQRRDLFVVRCREEQRSGADRPVGQAAQPGQGPCQPVAGRELVRHLCSPRRVLA